MRVVVRCRLVRRPVQLGVRVVVLRPVMGV
jgi:hypothetical protein